VSAADLRPEPLARRLPWLLAALCAVWFAALAPRLVYPDLNLDYPFVDGDSHDWIANGLHFAGHDVRYSGRSPLLPLLLAGLDRLGMLRAWPLLNLLLFLATVLGFYALAARLAAPAAAFAAALILLASYTLEGLALEVMADLPASCLMLWSAWAFVTALEVTGARPCGDGDAAGDVRRGGSQLYVLSGLLAGLAALTQQIGLIVPLAAAALWLLRRRRELATPWPWIGALLAAGCTGLWLVVKRWAFAAYGDSLLDQWGLVGWHVSSLRPYLWSLLSCLGLPACLLLAAGIVVAARQARRGQEGHRAASWLFVLLLLAGSAGFFSLLYGYEAKRFTVYAAWPAALLIAGALDPLTRRQRPAGRAAFWAAAALAIGGAAVPLPEPAHDGNWAALWPLPPVVAARRGAVPWSAPGVPTTAPHALGAATIARLPLATAAHWSVMQQVLRAWADRPLEAGRNHSALDGPREADRARPEPRAFAADLAALYLFDSQEDGGGRYRTITRLSNALWKPVRFVPRAALAPYWQLIDIRLVARLTADYIVYRATLPGIAGSWLLVTPGDRPILVGPAAAAPGSPAAPGNPPAPARLRRAAAEAAAIASWIGRGQAYVALFPSPASRDPAQLYLLFLVQTTELYVVEPADAAATRRFLGQAPVEAERRFGSAIVQETRVRGLRTAVVTFSP
jgi:4-amino-4-deoxy-L-arabinose transferase-like glycosyltransferase